MKEGGGIMDEGCAVEAMQPLDLRRWWIVESIEIWTTGRGGERVVNGLVHNVFGGVSGGGIVGWRVLCCSSFGHHDVRGCGGWWVGLLWCWLH